MPDGPGVYILSFFTISRWYICPLFIDLCIRILCLHTGEVPVSPVHSEPDSSDNEDLSELPNPHWDAQDAESDDSDDPPDDPASPAYVVDEDMNEPFYPGTIDVIFQLKTNYCN